MNDSIYETFDAIDPPIRILCIDTTYTGICLFKQGKERSGRKLILTAVKAAGLSTAWVDILLKDPEKSLGELAAHTELRELA